LKKTKLTGRVVYPDDPAYHAARTNVNLSIPKFPGVIVFCQRVQDVVNALRWARENEIPFRVRSGRHSYENFSLVNAGLIIDVGEMTKIMVDRKNLTATIEAGAELGQTYYDLWKHGVTVPAGTVFNVGLAGLTLGGGIGPLSRIFGLTCDNLIEVEIVKAAGTNSAEVIHANKEENSDLFWACCGGGGGNFGIVTSFTFKVHPISNVSIFSIAWGWEDFENAFDAWQNWAPYTDERLTAAIELHPRQVDKIEASGEFVGPVSQLKKLLSPLLKAGKPTKSLIKEVSYIEAVKFFNNPEEERPALFKRSGSYIYKPLSKEAIQTMKTFLANAPSEKASIWQQALAGAIERYAPEETAYFHRKAILAQEYNTVWSHSFEEQRNIRWIKELRNAMSPYTFGDYVNWPDLQIKDWPISYYGTNFHRLRKVKTMYDPFDIFHFPQSIPPFSIKHEKS
jgi:FAD/FMN-containing dehydrogenase